jgi:hypothetical protein
MKLILAGLAVAVVIAALGIILIGGDGGPSSRKANTEQALAEAFADGHITKSEWIAALPRPLSRAQFAMVCHASPSEMRELGDVRGLDLDEIEPVC